VIVILSLLALLHRVIGSIDTLSIYLTPLAIAPIILTVFLNSRIGLVTAFFLPLMVSLISGPDSQFVMSATLAGIAATYNSRDLKDRLQFYAITPGLILLAYLLVHTGFTLSRFTDMRSWVEPLLYFGINAISILLIYPIVMLFERLFDMTTDFTLLELSDTNHPLLKELMNKAPGTFHHSLQVGNLSEAAANEIGANALLCRTAALYHDIGKMKRPYYFTENQSGQNEHDNIKPSMSAMIIKDHVTQGVQMAREHKLPQAIIDFIQTHHGTTLVSFFYKKAKETSENPDEIKEESFRYDGPLPFSKETGILMLADTVEAASRSLKDPTYTKLENLIDKLVDHKMDGKQLSRTPLTFKEIEKIKGVFLTILSGIYHSRVEYPEEQKAK
jgi:putative nucleotidyltransferase with HDIG domain